MKLYEGMFLIDSALATDWPAAEAEVKRILDRAGAKIIGLKNWDERKLAFTIRTHKRGLYVLSYFEAPPDKIEGIERDVQLSEKVIRVLILRREKMTPEEIQKALTAAPPPKTPMRASDEWSGPPRGRSFEPRDPESGDMRGGGVAIDEVPPDVINDV